MRCKSSAIQAWIYLKNAEIKIVVVLPQPPLPRVTKVTFLNIITVSRFTCAVWSDIQPHGLCPGGQCMHRAVEWTCCCGRQVGHYLLARMSTCSNASCRYCARTQYRANGEEAATPCIGRLEKRAQNERERRVCGHRIGVTVRTS